MITVRSRATGDSSESKCKKKKGGKKGLLAHLYSVYMIVMTCDNLPGFYIFIHEI